MTSSNTSLDLLSGSGYDGDSTNFADDDDSATVEYDSDIDRDADMPETWSELVDKKVTRKMPSKDIKRQDVIYGRVPFDI